MTIMVHYLKHLLATSMVDMFTHWIKAIPVPDTTAVTTAKAIFDHWICCWGLFCCYHSDHGPAFDNEVMESLAKHLGLWHTITAPGTPHENPYAEWYMRPIGDALTAYANHEGNNWDQLIPAMLFAFQARVHSRLMNSPFHNLLGWDPRLPAHLASGALGPATQADPTEPPTPIADCLAIIHEVL